MRTAPGLEILPAALPDQARLDHADKLGRNWLLVILAGVTLLATGVNLEISRRITQERRASLVPSQEGTPLPGPASDPSSIRLAGFVEATAEASIAPAVEGRVMAIFVEPGAQVRRGQVVARLSPGDSRVEIARAEAQLVEAQAAAIEAEIMLARINQAIEDSEELSPGQPGAPLSPDHDLVLAATLAAAQYSSAAAHVEAEAAAFRVARRRLGQHVLRAPVDGFVVTRLAQPGDWVMAGTSLLRIAADPRRLHLVVPVPERQLARIEQGQEAHFSVPAYPGRSFEGRLVKLLPALALADGTRRFVAILETHNADLSLQPGMTAEVELALKIQAPEQPLPKYAATP
jgi:HlyD family secretion protein